MGVANDVDRLGSVAPVCRVEEGSQEQPSCGRRFAAWLATKSQPVRRTMAHAYGHHCSPASAVRRGTSRQNWGC
eukprot:4807857-Prymnesium_polylepis.1